MYGLQQIPGCLEGIGTQGLLAFGIGPLGLPEMVVIGILALLFFGRRLPEVGRSLGKGIVEFKKGLKDTGDEIKELTAIDGDPPAGKTNQTKDEPKSDSTQGNQTGQAGQ